MAETGTGTGTETETGIETESGSIHTQHIAAVHNVPMRVLIRPIPSVLDPSKVRSLVETLQLQTGTAPKRDSSEPGQLQTGTTPSQDSSEPGQHGTGAAPNRGITKPGPHQTKTSPNQGITKPGHHRTRTELCQSTAEPRPQASPYSSGLTPREPALRLPPSRLPHPRTHPAPPSPWGTSPSGTVGTPTRAPGIKVLKASWLCGMVLGAERGRSRYGMARGSGDTGQDWHRRQWAAEGSGTGTGTGAELGAGC
ncbi:sulfiredoxin-1 isoform 1-T1 [Mergus octosetaceus]